MTLNVDLADARSAGVFVLASGIVLPLLDHPGPGCFLRAATGVPCPLCGMSTSVQSTLRGDFERALAANPAGVLAVVAAVVLVFWRTKRSVSIPVWAAAAFVGALWVFELARFA